MRIKVNQNSSIMEANKTKNNMEEIAYAFLYAALAFAAITLIVGGIGLFIYVLSTSTK